MKHKRKLKRILIPTVSLVLVAAIGCGLWYYFGHRSSDPVNVYAFDSIGMTEYWGDSQQSYGPVTTDKVQTVYLSDTQSVTEILVAPGDTVKKGDLLMTFDTTLSDLALERKRLDVEKLKLQLEDAKEQLAEINSMKPMVIPAPSEEPAEPENPDLGTALTGPYQISTQSTYDGSSQELALICWLSADTAIDDTVLEAIRTKAAEYQAKNAEAIAAAKAAAASSEETSVLPSESSDTTGESSLPEPEESSTPADSSAPTGEPSAPAEESSSQDSSLVLPEPTVDSFYVIFKITESDMSLGETLTWQGMQVHYDAPSQSYRFRFFDAFGIPDHMRPASNEPAPVEPDIDFGSGYTSEQIAQMRSEQEKAIKDLEFQIKMAEAEYKIMQTEASDGNVYSDIDGTVASVLTEEEARMQQQPLIKVSGGGGFYIQGTISELEKENLQIGQEVTINDWETGMTYTGSVESLADYPSSDNYYSGSGNPNVTYYPFKVFVDESADLQSGRYVNIMYSTAVSENGIYLENPFLRTEHGQSYVYVKGTDGLLEKRNVTTGKSLWGSYTEILSGITPEDQIAFPYGKNVKAGAPAVESDLSTLYEP